MKVLIIDTCKCALDVAYRAQEAGHDVRYWLPDTKGGNRRPAGDGIVPRVADWKPSMKWADLILTSDNCNYADALQPYFNAGFPVFGCNKQAGELELDRDKGMAALEACGIEIMPAKKFTSYADAIAYVKKTGKAYACKPIGEAPKEYSYVGKSAADLVYKLQQWKKDPPINNGFVLQDLIKGTEMAVGGWFGSSGWSQWLCENWEFKKLFPGDYGVSTGEQGTVVRYVKKSQLFDDVLKPCTDLLFAMNYVGYVDIAVIIDDKGIPWPLEWTCRFGWPLQVIQAQLHKGDPVVWMADLLEGRDTLKVSEDVATGVVVTHGDFPYLNDPPETHAGAPIYGLDKSVLKNFHLMDVCMRKAATMKSGEVVDEMMMCTAGNYIGVAVGTGDTVAASAEAAYEIADKISVPSNLMLRNDIGKRLQKQLPKIQEFGYAKGLSYD